MTFERSFIRSAVCELRFPILLEMESSPPPSQLGKRLRREYPLYERKDSVSLKPGSAPVETENIHCFMTKTREWTVAFKAYALSLETKNYEGFTKFLERLMYVVEGSRTLIDADFFTRVGLRYVNALPARRDLSGWVRKSLVESLADGTYGDVELFQQQVRGIARRGKYTFRHGIGEFKGPPEDGHEYTLDFDFYAENVPFDSLQELLNDLHSECFAFFCWAIGEEARTVLGRSTPKNI